MLCEDCGKEIKTKNTKKRKYPNKCRSCAGKVNQKNLKHGDKANGRRSTLYTRWIQMKSVCYSKTNKDYKKYGALGIIVCEHWHIYLNFKQWAITNGYKEGDKIIRKHKWGNFSPLNCQIVTPIKHTYYFNKEYLTPTKIYNYLSTIFKPIITKRLFSKRLRKGMPPTIAFTTPKLVNQYQINKIKKFKPGTTQEF